MEKDMFAEKSRFLYLKENIGLLNIIVHSGNDYETRILKKGTTIHQNETDEKLTLEIYILKKAVERFEMETGLTIEVK